jgi:hypothetical protein
VRASKVLQEDGTRDGKPMDQKVISLTDKGTKLIGNLSRLGGNHAVVIVAKTSGPGTFRPDKEALESGVLFRFRNGRQKDATPLDQ